MAQVQTVQGPVDAGELGTVLIHEHVRFRDEAVADQWPSQYDDEQEMGAALESVRAAADRGVDTIFDHLRRLQELQFLRREVPVTEWERARSQRVLYRLADGLREAGTGQYALGG